MRWNYILLAAFSLLLFTSIVPDDLQGQRKCYTCHPNRDYTKYKCWGFVDKPKPDRSPYCFGTLPFGIACHSCGPRLAMETGVSDNAERGMLAIALDGSFPQKLEYRSLIARNPQAGLTNIANSRSVVMFPCNRAIAARWYDRIQERRLRRESTVIVI